MRSAITIAFSAIFASETVARFNQEQQIGVLKSETNFMNYVEMPHDEE